MAEPTATRDRILVIARELFAAGTYAGTSMADIAARLGTSKAALYHHFQSKEAILDELLADPAAALAAVAAHASRPRPDRETILAGLIDLFADSASAASLFGNDASALADYQRRHNPEAKIEQILAALTGPRPTTAKRIRAQAAMAVTKEGCAAALSADGKLSPPTHKEILDAALRVLQPAPRSRER